MGDGGNYVVGEPNSNVGKDTFHGQDGFGRSVEDRLHHQHQINDESYSKVVVRDRIGADTEELAPDR